MEYNKGYQYKNLVKVSAVSYFGTVGIMLINDVNNNVSDPVNKPINIEVIENPIIEDTLSNQEDS